MAKQHGKLEWKETEKDNTVVNIMMTVSQKDLLLKVLLTFKRYIHAEKAKTRDYLWIKTKLDKLPKDSTVIVELKEQLAMMTKDTKDVDDLVKTLGEYPT